MAILVGCVPSYLNYLNYLQKKTIHSAAPISLWALYTTSDVLVQCTCTYYSDHRSLESVRTFPQNNRNVGSGSRKKTEQEIVENVKMGNAKGKEIKQNKE